MDQRGVFPDTHVHRADAQVKDSFNEAIPATPRKSVNWIENKSILTPTSGFLDSGYTHTLNPYVGCSNALHIGVVEAPLCNDGDHRRPRRAQGGRTIC